VTKRFCTVAMTQESINFDLEQIYSIPYMYFADFIILK